MKFLYALLFLSLPAIAGDWESSPNNWKNSPNNWENSSNNWKNSPNNWQNSPNNSSGNNGTVRNSDGSSAGYAVPKADGGVNIYDNNGNRTGYIPSRR